MEALTHKSINNTTVGETSKSHTGITVIPKKVKPQKFLWHSFYCQNQAAHIRNRLIDSIQEKDTAMVAFRYLQSKPGCLNVRCQSCSYSVLTALLASVYSRIFFFPLVLPVYCFLSVYCFSNVVINIRNSIRYTETIEIANNFLKKNLDDITCTEIEGLMYLNSDLNELLHNLSASGIDVEKLKEKIISRELKSRSRIRRSGIRQWCGSMLKWWTALC